MCICAFILKSQTLIYSDHFFKIEISQWYLHGWLFRARRRQSRRRLVRSESARFSSCRSRVDFEVTKANYSVPYFQYIHSSTFRTLKRAYFGNSNYFGGPDDMNCRASIALSQAQLSVDTMLVFLSDVWLDSPLVSTS